ncbi:hypothetical protein E2C01_101897 [Portunus trituberculatus]|uniref:Uncharacterized protein n=1 Tax=Portunus trituberculatus TaxID=210409 RepID=A0A5B7KLA8_PORTR|nr:hypothetical protein [Portunus trituberculatus]
MGSGKDILRAKIKVLIPGSSLLSSGTHFTLITDTSFPKSLLLRSTLSRLARPNLSRHKYFLFIVPREGDGSASVIWRADLLSPWMMVGPLGNTDYEQESPREERDKTGGRDGKTRQMEEQEK